MYTQRSLQSKPSLISSLLGATFGALIGAALGPLAGVVKFLLYTRDVITKYADIGADIGFTTRSVCGLITLILGCFLLPIIITGALTGFSVSVYRGIKNGYQCGLSGVRHQDITGVFSILTKSRAKKIFVLMCLTAMVIGAGIYLTMNQPHLPDWIFYRPNIMVIFFIIFLICSPWID